MAAALAAATVWVSWIEYQERVRLFEASRRAHEAKVERAGAYVQLQLGLERPPTALSLLSRGVGERLGSSATIPGLYGEVALSRRDRPVAEGARQLNLDVSWVLTIVVGFACVFFAHGAVNGEREKGTLKQQLAKGLPRFKVLLGEYLGGVLAVVLPCGLLLLGFALWAIVAGPSFGGEESLRVVFFFALVVLYGCFWTALALFLSVVCRQPETSLVMGILAWVLAAALYPQVAGWTASRMAPGVSGELRELVDAASVEDQGHRDRLMARRNALSSEYRLYRRLGALLPVTAFLDAGQALAGTSVSDHEQFLRSVDNADLSFRAWQAEKLARHPRRDRTVLLGEPLDIEGLPVPVHEPTPVTRSLRQAGLPAGALLFGTAMLLVGAVVGFDRLDVR